MPSVFSFVKELDDTTLKLLRRMSGDSARLTTDYRGLHFVVIWVDGDQDVLAHWVEKHKLTGLSFAVVEAGDPELARWQISPQANSTTVVLRAGRPLANLVDLRASNFEKLEATLAKHLKRQSRN